MAPPHPLRRISTGSLTSLARSQDRAHTSPSGLDFLGPAMTELADEAATLSSNVGMLNDLHHSLGLFNESFAGWLYALKMNAFCVEWPLAPDENSFARIPALTPQPTTVQSPAKSPAQRPSPPSNPSTQLADLTYATNYSNFTDSHSPPAKAKTGIGARKTVTKKVVGGLGAGAIKRKRELEIADIIDKNLPLEYRGGQPAARVAMEKLIARLMEQPDNLTIKDMVALPDLPQPKVNKCLIALVTKKIVSKTSSGGTTWYRWVGI